MSVVVGIPARMGSSRLPGKPLKKIMGMTMIEHVYRRCQMAKHVDYMFVATCDEEIKDEVESFNGNVYMTRSDIERPGLRVAEASKQQSFSADDIIVVVQGDEPLLHPEMIDLAVKPLMTDPEVQVLTLIAEMTEDEWHDPNEVKVTIDKYSDVLYMTRSPIPSNTRNRIGPRFKQVAIMPFRQAFLLEFQRLLPMPLEVAESIELLRALEHGIKVRTANSSAYDSMSVDTEADRTEAERLMVADPLFDLYRGAS